MKAAHLEKMISKEHPEYIQFPNPNTADEHGFLGHGGDLEINTLLSAYQQGIFPWFNEEDPILWWSPNPRMILSTSELHISRSLSKTIRSGKFTVSCNTAFNEVISQCSKPRVTKSELDPSGSWITADMKQAYNALFQAGYAVSIETWYERELVGGLYGVTIAGMYFGESMFSRKSDASKVALHALCQFLAKNGAEWIDCQVESPHLVSLGATNISRENFIAKIHKQLEANNILNWGDFCK